MKLTEEQMRRAVEDILSQEPDERTEQKIRELTGGRSVDEYFTDIYQEVVEEDLMSFQEFRRVSDRDNVSDDFLSGWVVVSREALRNILRLVVRDGIGMTDNLDSVRRLVRKLNLRPDEKPIPNPFERFRVEETTKTRTIWDDSVGMGINFEKGDKLARHRFTMIVPDRTILTTTDGMCLLDITRERLLRFAEERFPVEFGRKH